MDGTRQGSVRWSLLFDNKEPRSLQSGEKVALLDQRTYGHSLYIQNKHVKLMTWKVEKQLYLNLIKFGDTVGKSKRFSLFFLLQKRLKVIFGLRWYRE